MASLVPEPMEKCAVWAASPSSTTGVGAAPAAPARALLQRAHATVGKVRQMERLATSRCGPRKPAKISSQNATVRSSGASTRPAARQVASEHSTIQVAMPAS
jgi:hypothetical protein